MSAVLMTPPFVRFFDNSSPALPLAGGKVYSYAAGTTTPQATYTDYTASTPNTNPVILDANGVAAIWISGSYKFVIEDSAGNIIKTIDNVSSFTTAATGGNDFRESFSGDGSTTAFTVSQDLGTDSVSLLVWVDAGGGKGYDILAPTAYTINGTTLTFSSAPASGTNNIYVYAPFTLLNATTSSATAAATSATNAATSATNAATSATNAAASATTAAGYASTAGSLPWAVAAGTADAITGAYSPAISTLSDGLLLGFRAASANATTTPTFKADSTTAHTITSTGGNALVAGNIAGNYAEYIIRYNLAHTRWELLNPTPVISSGLTVGTTTISGGTSGSVEYNNSGVLGEKTVASLQIMTALAVGSIILANYSNSGTPIAAGSTTASSKLTCQGFCSNTSSAGAAINTGDSLSGTWLALQTNPGVAPGAGSLSTLFQRTV